MYLIILQTKFTHYFLSSIIADGMHTIAYALIGIHIRMIQRNRKNENFLEQEIGLIEISKFSFSLVIILLNVLFVYLTYKKYKKLENEINHNELHVDIEED